MLEQQFKQTKVFLKYDGKNPTYENHQIDAKVLASSLESVADLIYDAHKLLNGPDSVIDVKAQAGFYEGSFGLELIIDMEFIEAVKDVLPIIGFTAAATGGSVLRVLKEMRGNKVQDLVINEADGTAKVITSTTEHVTSPEIAELINSKPIRERIDRLIRRPLERDDTEFFKVMESNDSDSETLFESSKSEGLYFKGGKVSSESVEDIETEATVEFTHASKESGNSGWKMLHLGQEVAVKIKDEAFLASLKKPNAPSVFGIKFKADLIVRKRTKIGQPETKTYTITSVRAKR